MSKLWSFYETGRNVKQFEDLVILKYREEILKCGYEKEMEEHFINLIF